MHGLQRASGLEDFDICCKALNKSSDQVVDNCQNMLRALAGVQKFVAVVPVSSQFLMTTQAHITRARASPLRRDGKLSSKPVTTPANQFA